jgi:hypothetical protein
MHFELMGTIVDVETFASGIGRKELKLKRLLVEI